MRRVVRPECKHGCRFLQITPTLFLCPHACYGATSDLKGAVDEARSALQRAGGYDLVLARIVSKEEEAKERRREEKEERQRKTQAGVKYR